MTFLTLTLDKAIEEVYDFFFSFWIKIGYDESRKTHFSPMQEDMDFSMERKRH